MLVVRTPGMAGGTAWSRKGIRKVAKVSSRASITSLFEVLEKYHCAGFSENRF